MRSRARLDAGPPLEDAPPLVAFTTVVFGGFRGLLADWLWLRAMELQDEGRYFELVQLADWITALEPRCTEVWSFHAWNMAFNVSAMMATPADRWRWVQNGLALLRDEGLRLDPDDPGLCWELGWLFQYKIGGSFDPAHEWFKREWAREMSPFFPDGRADGARLAADPTRVQQLQDRFKLNLATLQAVDAAYGPLDWRLPYTHAVYWAYAGLQAAGPTGDLACSRMIYQNMAESFRYGRLDYRPDGDVYRLAPEPRLLARARQAYEAALAKYPHRSVATAYASFLKDAIVLLHAADDDPQARELFAWVQVHYPSAETAADFDAFLQNHVVREPLGP
jgi:hypothetical protein